jgi:ectoine hydroxylase-related dioxygenase (phytanoyl-CoA dioxygenase family)
VEPEVLVSAALSSAALSAVPVANPAAIAADPPPADHAVLAAPLSHAPPRHPPRRIAGDVPPAPFAEDDLLALPEGHATRIAAGLPLATRFRLRAEITPVQAAFLQRHGYIVFDRVASDAEVDTILAEVDRVEAELLAAGKRKVYGVPVWFGADPDGKDFLFRMGFTSVYSPFLGAFVRDPRFEPIRRLIGADARIGDEEKDGVVFNRYVRSANSIRPNLAWHTDALRDVFYNRKMPGPMLNVGLHFDRIRPADGGLRVLPGTHTQGVWSTLFRKIHFVTDAPDRREVAVETWPGDLTVHDGRMWHRVEASPATGWASLRRSMYVPYVIDAYQPKSEASATPAYMRLFDRVMRWRASRARRRIEGQVTAVGG